MPWKHYLLQWKGWRISARTLSFGLPFDFDGDVFAFLSLELGVVLSCF